MKQAEVQPKQKKRFNLGIITILLLSVVSLTAFGFAKEFQTKKDDLPSVSEQTQSTSVQTSHTSIDDEEITPDTWRSINLEMRKADGSIAKIDLLRPLWWLEESKAEVGGTIALSMPEMGIEGEAKILSIGPCKADSRKGDPKYRVVTGKFTHENAIVLDLYFNNNPNDPLGVTSYHPLWSATRNGWVKAGHLKVGEYVKTKDGIAQLTMRSQRPGRHKVYNLEVHKDHSYYVSNLGILAHNGCAGNLKGMSLKDAKNLMSKWDKSTYKTLSDSIRDHAKRHGFGDNILKYLRKAANFNKKGATKKILEDGATRWNRKNGEFLIERAGKIVSYGVN